MNMPSISVLGILALVTGIFAALLWYLSGRSSRIASTSQELLDLFEDNANEAPKRRNIDLAARTR